MASCKICRKLFGLITLLVASNVSSSNRAVSAFVFPSTAQSNHRHLRSCVYASNGNVNSSRSPTPSVLTTSRTRIRSRSDTSQNDIINSIATTEQLNNCLHNLIQNKKIQKAYDLLKSTEKSFIESKTDIDSCVEPDPASYSIVISGYAKQRNPQKALMILSEMEELSNDFRVEFNLLPNRVVYNSVISAFANSGDTLKCLELFKKMRVENSSGRNKYCQPDVVTYNAILNGYAKKGMGQEAENFLRDMLESDTKPNIISYATVISAWARGNVKNKTERAEMLLEEMEELSKSGDEDIYPTTYCVNAVLNAHTTCGTKESIHRAELILDRMEYLNRNEVRPDTISYNILISAYAKLAQTSKAESLLLRMEQRAKDNPLITPNSISFNTVIHAHAKSKEKGAADRAEAILFHMEKLYQTKKYPNIQPNVATYATVMHAWATKGEAERTEQILKHIEHLYKAGNKEIKPNTICYNTAINAWAKSQHRGAAKCAHDILDKMEEFGTKPDILSYTSVIDSYAKLGNVEEAVRLLEKAETSYNSTGDLNMKPNVRTYTSVINAIAKSKHHPEKASAILNHIENLSKTREYSTLRPDTVCFNAALNAWAWSDHPSKVQRAHSIYQHMKALHDSSENVNAKPDVYSANSVLNACAYSNVKEKRGTTQILDIAIQTYEEIQESGYIRPDHITYGTLLMVCNNLMINNAQRSAIVETIFWKCCKDGQVSSFVLSQVVKLFSMQEFNRLIGSQVNSGIVKNGRIELRGLPMEWKRNAKHVSRGSKKWVKR